MCYKDQDQGQEQEHYIILAHDLALAHDLDLLRLFLINNNIAAGSLKLKHLAAAIKFCIYFTTFYTQ